MKEKKIRPKYKLNQDVYHYNYSSHKITHFVVRGYKLTSRRDGYCIDECYLDRAGNEYESYNIRPTLDKLVKEVLGIKFTYREALDIYLKDKMEDKTKWAK